MRRLFLLAAFVVIIAPTLWSQMRGSRATVPVGRFGFPIHNSFGGGFGFGHNRFFFNRGPFFLGHRHNFFFGGSFASPYYYPYYDGGYGGYSYPVVVQTAPAPAYYPEQYYEQSDLRHDVDVLTGKVDRLQRDVEGRQPVPRPPVRSQEVAPRQTTILVFKDQHVREVENYAIVGETLWVLNEEKADKIPLADLDLDSTVRFNDERGMDFQVPRN
jgi:hypothetical protein